MAQQMDAIERARSYGVRMDESLDSSQITAQREDVDHGVTVWLDDPRLAKVVRLRLIGYSKWEYPRWDISYCYGQLKPGTDITLAEGKNLVRVNLPMRNLSKFWQRDLIAWGRENRIYVKGLGILDEDVCSRLYG